MLGSTLYYFRLVDLLAYFSSGPSALGHHMQPQTTKWKERRHGFKNELILTLVDEGFTVRESEAVVEAIFDAIKTSLLKHEDVYIEGFGAWTVEERAPKARRGYRFGRAVTFRHRKIRFRMEDYALLHAYDPAWQPHTSWSNARKQPKKLRGKKLAELLRRQEELRLQALYVSYVRAIVRFFGDQLYAEDWHMFWGLRWNTKWFEIEAKRTHSEIRNLRPIYDATQIIEETKPTVLAKQWSNRLIELICWYARWTTQLDVDQDLWKEAEQKACDLLKHPDQWPTIYADIANI